MIIETRVKQKQNLIIPLVILLALMTLIDDYRGWRFLLLGLAGAWGLSRWWACSLARHLRLRREMRFGWAQVGDQLEQRFTLTNLSGFPATWVELEDHSDLPGIHANLATGIEGHSLSQWRKRGICQQRGLFNLGPTTLHTSDPLGLFQVTIHDPQHVSLLVTPPIIPLPQIEVAPGGRAGEGQPRPYAHEKTVSANGVRPFAPGDSLRWIHWPTSARHDGLFIRTFESRPSGDWWILLDFDETVQRGEGALSTVEHGVILAASLADHGLRKGRAVGFATYGQHLVWLSPEHSESQRWRMLNELALLKPGKLTLNQLIGLMEARLTANSSLIIITPNEKADWLKSLLPLVWRGAVPTLLLLDPSAFGENKETNDLQKDLAQWGIHYVRITPDLLNRPEAQPGIRGRWDWRVTPTGRAVLINPPCESGWKGF